MDATRSVLEDLVEELQRLPWDYGFLCRRDLGDGRCVWIYRFMFTHAICIGRIGALCYDGRWCYETLAAASTALDAWDPLTMKEPEGWHRHPDSGRRRPDGDAAREYINL